MKTLKHAVCLLLISLLVIPVMTSCSDDDEDISVGTPKYESISGKYIVDTPSSPYESIELGASGSYIITHKYGRQGTQAKQAAESAKKNLLLRPAQSPVLSRATNYNGVIYGSYTELEDGTLKLDGFGILKIVYGSNDKEVVGFILTPTGSSQLELDVTKEETMKDDELTNALCRTWKVESIRAIESINGRKGYDKTFTATNYEEGEDLDRFPTEVLFSKSGTYMVYYDDETLGISSWKWKSQKDCTILYSWNNDWYDDEFVTLSFSGKRVTIYEVWEEDDEDGLWKSESYTVLVEKYVKIQSTYIIS